MSKSYKKTKWYERFEDEDGDYKSINHLNGYAGESDGESDYEYNGGSPTDTSSYEDPDDALERERLLREMQQSNVENDEKLINLASNENKLLSFDQNGNVVNFHASTVLAQSIHHATEHRAQIDDILSFKGAVNLNLDSIDIWSFDRQINLGKNSDF